MSVTKGKIAISRQDTGSKSQGAVAHLHTADGKRYTLYRENIPPQDDPFFEPLDNHEATVKGSIEEAGHYICVQSITLTDGTQLLAPAPLPTAPISIFSDTPAEPAATKYIRRLPRKLKKQIKKQKNNK